MKSLLVYSLKGGVGKSTMALHLSVLAATSGLRTLLMDMDPQGASTFFLNVEESKHKLKGVLKGSKKVLDEIRGSDIDGLDLLPANLGMRNLDHAIIDSKDGFKPLFARFEGDYDFLVIDSPPQIGPGGNALIKAAQSVLVPLIPSPLSMRTLEILQELLSESAQGKLYPIYSMVDRRKKIHRSIVEVASSQHPVFLRTSIPHAADFEAVGINKAPIFDFAPKSPGAQAYRDLFQELQEKGIL